MNEFRLICYSTSYVFLMCYVLTFIRWKYSFWKTIVVTVLTTSILIGLECVRYQALCQGVQQMWTIFAQIIILQISAFYMSYYRDPRGLFAALTSSHYTLFGNTIARIVYLAGAGLLQGILYGVLLHIVILIALICFLRPSFMKLQYSSKQIWLRLCILPMVFCAVFLLLKKFAEYNTLIQNVAFLCVLLTMYLIYVLIFQMAQKIYEGEQLKKERDMLDFNIKTLKRTMEEVYIVEQKIAVQNHVQCWEKEPPVTFGGGFELSFH